MRPSSVPSGAKTWTPPGPVANTLPSLSTFRPSGKPGILPIMRRRVVNDAALAERAVGVDRESHPDGLCRVGLRDVQRLLVGREGDAVGPRHLVGQQRQLAVRRQPVHAAEIELAARVVLSASAARTADR